MTHAWGSGIPDAISDDILPAGALVRGLDFQVTADLSSCHSARISLRVHDNSRGYPVVSSYDYVKGDGIAGLRSGLDRALRTAQDLLGDEVALPVDCYRHLPVDAAFDMTMEASELTVGQVSE